MRNIILYLFCLVLISSCTDEFNSIGSNEDKVLSDCIPYVEVAFSDIDFLAFPIDEGTTILSHAQEGDCLILNTQFSGGCEEHTLQLLVDVNSQSSINSSTIFPAKLSHNNTDNCEALIAFQAFVDISALGNLNFEFITLAIEGYDKVVQLNF